MLGEPDTTEASMNMQQARKAGRVSHSRLNKHMMGKATAHTNLCHQAMWSLDGDCLIWGNTKLHGANCDDCRTCKANVLANKDLSLMAPGS
jgi:hypothetical protein